MSTSADPSSAPVHRAWDHLCEAIREACLLQQEGETHEARRMLREEVPARLAAWSKLDAAPSAVKQERLRAMFTEERQRAADLGSLQRMIVRNLAERVLPSLAGELRPLIEEARRRRGLSAQEAREAVSEAARGAPRKTARPRVTDPADLIDAANAADMGHLAEELAPLRELARQWPHGRASA